MATPEELREAAKIAKQEFSLLNDQLIGINGQIKEIVQSSKDLDKATQNVVKTYQTDFNSAVNSIKSSGREVALLQAKQAKGTKLNAEEQKKLAKASANIAKQRAIAEESLNGLRKNGAKITKQQIVDFEEGVDKIGEQVVAADELNTELTAQKGIGGALLDNAKSYLEKIDKTGLAVIALNGKLNQAQKLSLASEAAFLAIAKATLEGSDRINNLQKNLGISYSSAYQLQLSLAATATTSEKLFVTSKDLNKAFTDLAAQTGLLADFGGDTLVTMTALTKQLGLGTNEASQLALLARTQGEDTEGILDNTVDTVNAINRQNKSAISAKAVLNDIATASKSIVVSLGMSPEILAEAATEARALGLNLEAVDKIASSLLDFESSIAAELEAELLLGQDINLEKARQAALTNDLATLSQEIGKNEGVINAFATGNRIQQEAAAKALGMSREELSGMVMQQEIMNLSQDEFIAKYGEQSYQQMQAQSASEKFAASMEKIQGIIADIGTIFAPIVDMFASVVGFLAKSEVTIYAITGALGALAAKQALAASKSILTAVGNIFASGFKMNPILGLALAAAGVGALFGAVKKAQNVKDGIAPASKGPFTITDSFGATAITAKGDGVAVSPNINRGSSDSGEQKRTNMLLEKLLAKDTNISMDGRKLNDSMQSSTVAYNIGV